MFAKLRPVLCCPNIPEEERIKAFYTTVASSVLWGAGCWSPSTNAQQLLSIHENRWLRSMLGGAEGPRRRVGGMVACNKTQSQCVEIQVESPRSVAQSAGCQARLGGTHGPEKGGAPWSRCEAKRRVVGNHEEHCNWCSRPVLEAPEEELGTRLRARSFQDPWLGLVGRSKKALSQKLAERKVPFRQRSNAAMGRTQADQQEVHACMSGPSR